MLHETVLINQHRQMGGKLVDFGGWNMPLHYGSQLEEHHQVRRNMGMFDVSHMTVVDVSGEQAQRYLQLLLANDVARLQVLGKALYSAMLNDDGGVIDDLIVYLTDFGYRLVVNCATREKDLMWMQRKADGFDVVLQERDDLAMIAVQGPNARSCVNTLLDEPRLAELSIFQGMDVQVDERRWFVARTGYTGEDGYEIILPNAAAESFWQSLAAAKVAPCGLAARDTLRLEAGMNLYGHEMDESISPLVANMAWTIAWQPQERAFIGREVLQAEREAGVQEKLVGVTFTGKGVLRADQKIFATERADDSAYGVITSGTFSPTLGYSVALARVPVSFSGDCFVKIRNKILPVSLGKPSFARNGKKVD